MAATTHPYPSRAVSAFLAVLLPTLTSALFFGEAWYCSTLYKVLVRIHSTRVGHLSA